MATSEPTSYLFMDNDHLSHLATPIPLRRSESRLHVGRI